jgi:hypothetical protein
MGVHKYEIIMITLIMVAQFGYNDHRYSLLNIKFKY